MRPLQHTRFVLTLAVVLLAQIAWAQNLFIEGDALSNRTYNSDNGPTNSQLTLDFAITQAGILQNILTWGETTGQNLSGIGQSFEALVLRPLNSTNYQVVFATGYMTVTNVGTNTFAISGTPFGLQAGDVIAHYGRGIPFSNNTGGPSSVYIATTVPAPVLGTTITVPSATYPLYDDGGRNYAIQVQALGQPFLVTTNSDNGPGSLRQAVLNADAFVSASTINFATNLSGQTITLTNGQITIATNLTIDASMLAGGIQINGNGNSRIFTVNGGTTVQLNSLTLTNGAFNNDLVYGGGAILNYGGLTVNNCTVAGNQAFNSGYGGGGGIESGGTLTVINSTFAGNQSNAGGSAGGAILNYGGLTVYNCTFVNNQAYNTFGDDAGGIDNQGTLYLTNSIICSNAPANMGGNSYQGANNLIDTNALLAPLGNYGGPTQTLPPLPGSPAINAGAPTTLTTDQRGYPRTVGGAPDIGAVELQTPFLVVTTNSDNSNTNTLRNVLARADTGSTVTFTNTLSGQMITLTNGQIVLGNNVTIDGSTLTNIIQLNGNASSRIFSVNGGVIALLNSLTITNGSAATGGGIANNGILTLNNSTIAGNQCGGGTYGGGGIYNSATLTVNNSTITGNQDSSADFTGGGIVNAGTLTVNNSTLAGNQSVNISDGGGGIGNYGTLTVNNSTLFGNQAPQAFFGGGGIDSYAGTLMLTNSIICSNTAPTGPNIYGAYSAANSLVDTNPLLKPLGNYGGPTQTMPPLPGSPAIDGGNDSVTNFLATDQIGNPRRSGLHVDIGAVEILIPVLMVSNTNDDSRAGSLRQVVSQATNSYYTTVTFANALSGQVIVLTNGQIVLATNLNIDGSGLANGITINGHHTGKVFETENGAEVLLNSLTITNGYDNTGSGGSGIYNDSGGSLTVNNCTIAGNTTTYYGGGIRNPAGNSLTVNQCTFEGNSANSGGGIVNGGTATVNQCTIVSNSASVDGGGIYAGAGTVTLSNSIVTGNTGTGADININSSLTYRGSNLVQNVSGGGSGPVPIKANPLLAPLGNYGGPTPTLPPLPGSPAIDGCTGGTSFNTDQRGFLRPVGPYADIGAVEVQSPTANPPVLGDITRFAGGGGALQFTFTNATESDFTVLTSTNLSLPLVNWTVLGEVRQAAPGQYQFTDPQAATNAMRFYRVRSP